ncbi:MAG: DMT family transporter [Alphaproteobacteria bacterium]|nr:DMT family transporter [Alphaproteobacteria bacterium]
MTDPASAASMKPDRPLTGIALMLAAMAMYMITDTIAKYLTDEVSPVQIVWSRYIFYVLYLAPIVLWRGVRRTVATARPAAHVWRSAAMLLSGTCFTISLAHLDLAFAITVAFVSPLFVTALSMVFLGEHVGPRRWAAVVVGFLGVLLVIRPGADFSSWSLLPILSAFLWAISLILTRRTGGDHPLTTLTYTTIVGLVGASIMVVPFWGWPSWQAWALMAFAAAWNLIGLTVMIRAFRHAPASTLAPFSYSQMLWSTLLGWAVFGNIPDLFTYIGGGIIVASGVYVWHRERVRARSQPA